MVFNYLLIAFRNIRKHFSFSLINMVGLSLGLATCFLLTLWIRHELSFDQFHEKKDQIYRVSMEYSFGGQTAKTAVSPTALLPALEKNFAEVESGVRFFNAAANNPYIVRKDDKLFEESKFYFADSTFFNVFSFKLQEGDPTTALTEPQSVLLTESMARKYFGDQSAVGQTVNVNNRQEFKVTGILEDLPSNSMIQFDFLASFSSLSVARDPIWWSANYQTYVVLAAKSDVNQLFEKTNALVKEELKAELSNPGDYVHYNFVPLTDLYLRSEAPEPEVVGSIQYIYIFSAIALLILAIACINYVNLATAKAADRAKEVGVRKVVGAHRQQLFLQFISESVLMILGSFLLALFMSSTSLSLFNSLTDKHFSMADLLDPYLITIALIVLIVLAALAGSYPAVLISSFKPTQILKGNYRTSGRGIWLRKTLVTFQFGISIVLLVCTVVIFNQLQFIQTQRLGYNKENVLLLPLDRTARAIFPQLKTELLRNGLAEQVGRAGESPTRIQGGYTVNYPGSTDRGMMVRATAIDEGFVEALGMEIMAGRNLTEEDMARVATDTVFSFLLNESALRELGLTPDDAVGTALQMNGRKGSVVGVVRDFHFSTLHEKISPLVLFSDNETNPQMNLIFIKLKEGDITSQLAGLKATCVNLLPHRPFEYDFLDDRFEALYVGEQRMSKICTVFASLAIFIACLGLLGLVSFAAMQKAKEIGIRKVMGASVGNIILLLTKDFSTLVAIAIAIGLPAAWYVMEHLWLTSFAYRVSVGVGPLVGSALFCLVVSFATSGYHAVKAALLNPADTLRNE